MAAKPQSVKNKSVKSSPKTSVRPSLTSGSLLEYFRAGESYTSLVLGIVVVIIASVLLLSLFKTRPDSQKGTTSISTIAQDVSVTPTPTLVKISGIVVNKSEALSPTPTLVPARDGGPTTIPSPRPANISEKPTAVKLPMDPKTYTIVSGDDLWAIAVKIYGDGYKWVDIAKANNLTDPGLIHIGNKLKLPEQKSTLTAVSPVPSDTKEAEPSRMQTPSQLTQKITGNTYAIANGDDLWSIAVRAYGDGYRWVDIAKVNMLTDPDLIFSKDILKIPR